MIVFEDDSIFDGFAAEPVLGSVVVEGGAIREVANGRPIGSGERIGLCGRSLMPGWGDLHVHRWVSEPGQRPVRQRTEYPAVYGAGLLRGALDRGFTILREAGGGGA